MTKTRYDLAVFFGLVIGLCLAWLSLPAFTVDFQAMEFVKYDKISMVNCETDSMGLTINCGDRLFVTKVQADDNVSVGSIYLFKQFETDEHLVAHRLVGCVDVQCESLIFKGDNNLIADPLVNRSQVIYKVSAVQYT